MGKNLEYCSVKRAKTRDKIYSGDFKFDTENQNCLSWLVSYRMKFDIDTKTELFVF